MIFPDRALKVLKALLYVSSAVGVLHQEKAIEIVLVGVRNHRPRGRQQLALGDDN